MITDVAAREAFHVLLLAELSNRLGEGSFVLKGGVNLRLYFGSPRYSEDIDLDGDPSPSKRLKLRQSIAEALGSTDLAQRLKELGIRRTEYSGKPHKDGDATLRYKLRVVTSGEIALATKIEVSFRDRSREDEWLVEPVEEQMVRPYLRSTDTSPLLPHYGRTIAVRQKIAALGGRRVQQARDVFDLFALTSGYIAEVNLQQVRSGIADELLDEARERAFAISYREFADQVLPFMDTPDRDKYESEGVWDELRLSVVELIEMVQKEPGGGEPA